ncbi:MAG: hypothetical protein KGS72_25975 [Cyanobacteria bacterium REEB67]|nr:hypothetical protein [Cyanobacteria bacterium REEB67]
MTRRYYKAGPKCCGKKFVPPVKVFITDLEIIEHLHLISLPIDPAEEPTFAATKLPIGSCASRLLRFEAPEVINNVARLVTVYDDDGEIVRAMIYVKTVGRPDDWLIVPAHLHYLASEPIFVERLMLDGSLTVEALW